MLDASNGEGVIDVLWGTIAQETRLPDPQANFYDAHGPLPMRGDSRRTYHRQFYRRRSILVIGKQTHGVYVKDFSKLGVGFLSPFQLFPRDVVTLVMPGPQKLQIEIRRCRRLDESCYDCGARFVDGETELTAASQEMLGSGI